MQGWVSRLGFGVFTLLFITVASARKVPDPEVLPRVVLKLKYPQTARDEGHQGTTRLSATLLPTGDLSDIKVLASSGSDILDKAALEASTRFQLPPPVNPKGVTKPEPVEFEVPFYKLPLINAASALSTFTCRDFVVDVAWFEANFPGTPRQEVRDYQAILAPILLRTMAGQGTPSFDAVLAGGRAIQAKRAALDAALITCRDAPDMLLIEAIAKAETRTIPAQADARP